MKWTRGGLNQGWKQPNNVKIKFSCSFTQASPGRIPNQPGGIPRMGRKGARWTPLPLDRGVPCTIWPLGKKTTAAPSTLPASVMVLNQSSSFSKQVSSVTGCLGSARTEQRAGRSWEHSGSMIRLESPAKKRSGPGPAHPNHRQPRCPLRPQNFHSRPGAAGPQSSEGAARVVLGGVPEQAGALSSGRPGWKGVWCKPRGLRC